MSAKLLLPVLRFGIRCAGHSKRQPFSCATELRRRTSCAGFSPRRWTTVPLQQRWIASTSARRAQENGKDDDSSKARSRVPGLPLHENIYTLPNLLTFSRLLAAPAVGYCIVTNMYTPALSLFIYAGVTDFIDGWIARRWHSQTILGTIIDPMADKALMTIVTVTLALKGALPVALATVIIGRDVLLSLSAMYYRYISLPPPRTLGRYWDFSLPSAEVRPTGISKINTFLQLGLLGGTMVSLALGGSEREILFGVSGGDVLHAAWWIVGGTTIWSGLSYVGGRQGLRILSQKKR